MLTNLTEAMKAKTKMTGYSNSWKYVQERIPVNKKHKGIAQRLVRIQLGLEDPVSSQKRRTNVVLSRYGSFTTKILPAHLSKVGLGSRPSTSSDSNDLRTNKLVELSQPCVADDDFRIFKKPDPPPKKESSSLSRDKVSRTSKTSTSLLQSNAGEKDKEIVHPEPSVSSVATGAESSNASVFTSNISITPLKKKSKRPNTATWVDSQRVKNAYTANAFSEASLALSHQTGLIDAEGHGLLRKVQQDTGKAKAYERVVPDMYMRDPKMFVGVKVPKLEDVHVSEAHFGSQKVCIGFSCCSF